MTASITLAVEGITDAAVARRLLREARLKLGPEYVRGGKDALDGTLLGYNNAARFSCWLVVRDLDRDADCAADLRKKLLPQTAPRMRLHIAVHAVEAWLLADAESMSDVLSVPVTRIPREPEAITHPKRALVDLARRSRKRSIREALVPTPGTSAAVGPGYAAFLIDYATNRWRPSVAAKRSDSLARLRTVLRKASQCC